VIRVTEGELTEVEVAAELKRLIPGTQDWKVQMVQSNVFRTAFPSTTELQRLVEWGTVHSKKKGVLFHFEEKQSEKSCKVLNSYWVQVMGIPLAYRTFPTIWAVGSLLGTSIDVDMKHTRQFEVGRVQVMILDANLIPSTVEVVIGEEVYLLSFRVEDGNGGLLPETDNVERGFNDDDDDLLGDDDGDDLNGVGPGQLGKMGDRAPAAATGGSFTHQSKTGTAQGAALDEESGMGFVAVSGGQQVAQDGAVEPYQSGSCSAQELAAIPEMLAGSKSTWSSKRRGASLDESTLERAERLKARLNEGNSKCIFALTSRQVASHLNALGFLLGDDSHGVDIVMSKLRASHVGSVRDQGGVRDCVEEELESEEREMAVEETLDRLLLKDLCGELTEEVLEPILDKDKIEVPSTSSTRKSKTGGGGGRVRGKGRRKSHCIKNPG
jgi:hypothetical protein